jgi:hypothetical protein
MPTDKDNQIDCLKVKEICLEVLEECSNQKANLRVYGEILHAVYGSAAKATFSFGQAYGTVIGIVEATTGEKIELIRAVDWQKYIFNFHKIKEVKKANSNRRDTKAMALHTALKLWREENWVESPRHRRIHDGMIDAALIAIYGEMN